MTLAKRTPGTPLSEAELQQRRDAARARWAAVGAIAAGAAGAAALEAGLGAAGQGAARLARWHTNRRADRAADRVEARQRAFDEGVGQRVASIGRKKRPLAEYSTFLGRDIARRRFDEGELLAGRSVPDSRHHEGLPIDAALQENRRQIADMEQLKARVDAAPKTRPKILVEGGERIQQKDIGTRRLPNLPQPEVDVDHPDVDHRATHRDPTMEEPKEEAPRPKKQKAQLQLKQKLEPLFDGEGKRVLDPDGKPAFRVIHEQADPAPPPAAGEPKATEPKARSKKPRGRRAVVRYQPGKVIQQGLYEAPAQVWPQAPTVKRWRSQMIQRLMERAERVEAMARRQVAVQSNRWKARGFGLARTALTHLPRATFRSTATAGLIGGAATGLGLWARQQLGKRSPEAIAAAARATATEVSDAQAAAGNYRKGRVHMHGLEIVIETPKGVVRSGVGRNGKRWSVRMPAHYGYLRRTEGADGDQLDVYLLDGAHDKYKPVFVIDQHNPGSGHFDEHKCVLGASSEVQAVETYDAAFNDQSGPRRRRAVTMLSLPAFVAWVRSGNTTEALGKAALHVRRFEPPLRKADEEEAEDDGPEEVPGERRLARAIARMLNEWRENPLQATSTVAQTAMMHALAPLEAAANAGASQLVLDFDRPSGRRIEWDFDVRDPRVARSIQDFKFKLSGRITSETQETIRRALTDGAEQGQTIPQQARAIREAIGLSPQQARWVSNYRAELERGEYGKAMARALRDRRHDPRLNRMIDQGAFLEDAQIDAMVDNYAKRVLAYRATTIARTEALRASNLGAVTNTSLFLRENPSFTVEKVWIATKDDRTRPDHVELDGKSVIGMETPFRLESGDTIRWPHDDQAPARQVVNCLLPGAEVFAVDVRAASRREYDGEAITIETVGGAKLTCTINHPILTERGWVAAQFLQEGDSVIRAARGDWNAVVDDHQHAPPCIEEIEDALHLSGLSRLQVAGAMDFHREGVAGEVRVVLADGQLVGDQHTALGQPSSQAALLGRHPVSQALLRSRLGGQPRLVSLAAKAGRVGGAHLGLARTLAHLRPLGDLGLTTCPRSAAVLAEHPADDVPGDAVLLGEGERRGAAIEGGEHRRKVAGLPAAATIPGGAGDASLLQEAVEPGHANLPLVANLLLGEPGLVERDQIRSVVRFPWKGHVYNLETESGLYIADGIISHNCRCTVAFRVRRRAEYGQLTAAAVEP